MNSTDFVVRRSRWTALPADQKAAVQAALEEWNIATLMNQEFEDRQAAAKRDPSTLITWGEKEKLELRQVAQGTSLLNDQRQEFRATLRALDRAVRTVAEFAVQNREEIVATLNGSADVMETVLDRQQQLAEILEVMPLALQNLQRAHSILGGRASCPNDRRTPYPRRSITCSTPSGGPPRPRPPL